MMDQQLDNVTAIITGGSRRLGRQISLHLADKGYNIVIHYNQSSKEAAQLAREIEEKGVSCRLFKADFGDRDGIEKTTKEVFRENEDYRVLINNASVFNPATFQDTSVELLQNYYLIHFYYPFFLTKYFARNSEQGVIINMLDSRVQGDDIDFFPYTLSKKSLASLTRMSAKALGPGIRVNAICPGPVLPPDFGNDELLEQKTTGLPLKKKVDPDDIIKGVDYLIDNNSVTGEFLFIDAGMHLTET